MLISFLFLSVTRAIWQYLHVYPFLRLQTIYNSDHNKILYSNHENQASVNSLPQLYHTFISATRVAYIILLLLNVFSYTFYLWPLAAIKINAFVHYVKVLQSIIFWIWQEKLFPFKHFKVKISPFQINSIKHTEKKK